MVEAIGLFVVSIICLVIGFFVMQMIGLKDKDGDLENPDVGGGCRGFANYIIFVVIICIAFFALTSC